MTGAADPPRVVETGSGEGAESQAPSLPDPSSGNPPVGRIEGQTDGLVVTARGLSKTFHVWRFPLRRERVPAVVRLELSVRRGEVLALLGPNGAGKTTTLLLLLGLLRPSEGEVRVFGHPPGHRAARALVGYLPEESRFHGFLSARQTLVFYAGLFPHLDRATRKQRTEELLGFVGLADAAQRPVSGFSKGMRRRLGLAQVLIGDPQLVVLDEPTSGLDPLGIREVKDLIGSLKGQGRTVLLSSHVLADVQDVCDRVVILDRGRLIEEGRLEDILAVRERTALEFTGLTDEARGALVAAAREAGATLVHEGHPRRSLEEHFLEVVAAARREEDTS